MVSMKIARVAIIASLITLSANQAFAVPEVTVTFRVGPEGTICDGQALRYIELRITNVGQRIVAPQQKLYLGGGSDVKTNVAVTDTIPSPHRRYLSYKYVVALYDPSNIDRPLKYELEVRTGHGYIWIQSFKRSDSGQTNFDDIEIEFTTGTQDIHARFDVGLPRVSSCL